jgi:serine/threonine protein kinase
MPQSHSQNKSFGNHVLAVGAMLQDRYQIVRQLGRGGMGLVYEAVDLRLGHQVAVKQTLSASQDLCQQFEHEARLMAGLDHPTLPRVSDYFTEGDFAFLIMQYIDGADLAETLARQNGPLPMRSVIAWADQLLDALIYLHTHDRQIIHRDIKPHNLKVTENGRIALLDFGLAKSQGANYEDNETDRSIFGYSPRYAPLEQIQDLGTTPQSDIYALGATLYHLLTGVKPLDAVVRATALIGSQADPLRPAHAINPGLGIDLSAILNRAMAQNPADRYATATEFRDALRRLGRAEVNEGLEFVAHKAPIEATVVEVHDEIVTAAVQVRMISRAGVHALAAVLVILLTAFGVLCRYYPWRMPETVTATNKLPESNAGIEQVRSVSQSTRFKKSVRRTSKLERALFAHKPGSVTVDNDY